MKYVVTILLILLPFSLSPSVYAQNVPSMVCLGSCPTIKVSPNLKVITNPTANPGAISPSNTVSTQPSSPPVNPSATPPATSPCSNQQTSVHEQSSGKNHPSGQQGFLQQFIQFLLQLLQFLFQQLGISLPGSGSTPCPTPAPSEIPSSPSPSTAPTSGNDSTVPTATLSIKPTSGVPTPTIFGTTVTLSPTSIPVPTSSISTAGMTAPSGYSKLIFDDQFKGTSLDTTKWYPQIGDQRTFPWNNLGRLAAPLSGPNQGGFSDAYYSPSQVKVNNGLTITATKDTSIPGYHWRSGVIDTHDKFKFNGGYLQVRAKIPDSRSGAWASIWSLEGSCEIDTQESGMKDLGAALVNQEVASHIESCPSTVGAAYNAGVDLSQAYHIYGMKYVPGKSITTYLDGHQVGNWTSNIPTGAETIILNIQIGAASSSGFHTIPSASTPDPLIYQISEVQVWQ